MEEKEIPQIKPKSILDPGDVNDIPKIEPQGGKDFSARVEEVKRDNPIPRRSFGKIRLPKFGRKMRFVGMGCLFILVLLIIFVVIPGVFLYKDARAFNNSLNSLQSSFDSQDIKVVEQEIGQFKTSLFSLQKSYKRFSWLRFVPFVSAYWKDGDAGLSAGIYGIETGELLLEAVAPYADIVGFAGSDSKVAQNGEETANDRIDFIIQTIDGLIPKIDMISSKARLVSQELNKIDPNRYPEKIGKVELRGKLKRGIELVNKSVTLLAESKPLLESAPYLLGIDEARTYLLLFQNDKELRPTGGFITAYSIMKVQNGKVSPVISSDIYNLDSNYTPSIDAPDPIVDYIMGPYKLSPKFRLRDINWSPDFRQSMELFYEEARSAGIDEVDGIIAVDTEVAVRLLDVIGEIGVPGFGNFSTKIDPACDCPQVIYELESFADVEGPIVWSENEPGKIVFAPPNYENRKKIVGPLMNSILSNTLGQPKEKISDLFEAGLNLLLEKHILTYFLDEKAQSGAEGFGIAGRIKDYSGDYLYIIDANLGGRKSNLYVDQEVAQEISLGSDGRLEKTLTITYKNTKDYDGWLNSVLPNWTRIYVPRGSELIGVEGFDQEGETYEESGKTVFSGGFELRPLGVKKIVLKYKLPQSIERDFGLFVQKQPGLDRPLYSFRVGRLSEDTYLSGDSEFKFSL